jgi:hypothetical protein
MERIKYTPQIDLFPKGDYNIYEIEPLKGNLTLNISTTLNRTGDKVLLFLSNLGTEKKISFDGGIDAKEIPIDRSGYLELVFNGKSFVPPFIGNLRGPKGEEGKQGPMGETGPIGIVGPSGRDGSSGTSGVSIVGPQGQPGINGTSGTSGISIAGPTGPKGEDGLNGINGRSCQCDSCLDLR